MGHNTSSLDYIHVTKTHLLLYSTPLFFNLVNNNPKVQLYNNEKSLFLQPLRNLQISQVNNFFEVLELWELKVAGI